MGDNYIELKEQIDNPVERATKAYGMDVSSEISKIMVSSNSNIKKVVTMNEQKQEKVY